MVLKGYCSKELVSRAMPCDVFGLRLVALLLFLGVWCIVFWGCLFELVLGSSLSLVPCNV